MCIKLFVEHANICNSRTYLICINWDLLNKTLVDRMLGILTAECSIVADTDTIHLYASCAGNPGSLPRPGTHVICVLHR